MRNLFGLLLLLRLVQDTALANSKQDKLFYIYDWPDVIKRQKTLRADEGNRHRMYCFWLYSLITSFSSRFLLYGLGTGKLLHNASVGLYNTDQFHLFRIMYHRALKDPRRTLNPDLVRLKYIQYTLAIIAQILYIL